LATTLSSTYSMQNSLDAGSEECLHPTLETVKCQQFSCNCQHFVESHRYEMRRAPQRFASILASKGYECSAFLPQSSRTGGRGCVTTAGDLELQHCQEIGGLGERMGVTQNKVAPVRVNEAFQLNVGAFA
jgi:hypothetical protein